MRFGTVALACVAAWVAWRWARAIAATRALDRLPPGVRPPPPSLRALSEDHHDGCTVALKEFAAAYSATFGPGGCGTDGKAAVVRLHELRDAALGHMYGLRMRLPNDVQQERELTQHIEATDRLLRDYLGDAQARCGAALLHPGPIDDLYYRHWWRAANDVAE